MGGACRSHGENETRIRTLLDESEGRRPLGGVRGVGKVKVKFILELST